MPERPVNKFGDELVSDFVVAVSEIEGVSRIVKVEEGDYFRIFVLVPEDSHGQQLYQVVRDWSRVVQSFNVPEEESVRLGPVFCEGQYEEFIEGTGGESVRSRKVTTLWESPKQAA